jgi:predicted transcriptional regulator
LGLEKPVTASAVQNALRRLADKNVVTRVDRGAYRFEDEAFAEWVQHQD